MVVRHTVNRAIRDYLNAHDFLEMETPVMTRSTPEGARDFLVPSRMSPGRFYALPQSPQLFKQMLMMAGYERYYQIARCFRDEDLRADRQPEFTQLDLEMSFVDEEDVIAVNEAMMARVFEATAFPIGPPPWPRMTYDEAMARYGSDRPDIRFGLEIEDLGEALAGSEFKVFSGTLESGGVVRGLNAGAREVPRKDLDALTEHVKRYGAGGLVWAFVQEDGTWRSPIAKFLTEEEIAAVTRRLGGKPGDLLLIVADKEKVAATALGELRLELSRRFELVPPGPPRGAVGRRLPGLRVQRGRAALGRGAPPVHDADGRLRRPGGDALAGLRPDPRRLGDRRRVDSYPPPRGPAGGLPRARDLRAGGRGALRLPARGDALRRAAARRHRVRARPRRGDRRGARLDPRRHRLPEDRQWRGPAHRRARAGRHRRSSRSSGCGSRRRRRRVTARRRVSALRRKVTLRTRAGSADRGRDMSQISPPIRILLIAVIGLVAVYMLFLRPKTEEATPAAAAPAATTPVPAKDPGAATSSGSGAVVQNAVKRTTDAGAQAKVAAGEDPGGLAADAATGTTADRHRRPAPPRPARSTAAPAPVTKADAAPPSRRTSAAPCASTR